MKKSRKVRVAEVPEPEASPSFLWPLLYAIGLVALFPMLWLPQDQWVFEDELIMQNPYVAQARVGKIASHRLWYGLSETEYGDPTYRPFVLLTAIPFPKIPQGLRLLVWLMHLLAGLLLFVWSASRLGASRASPWPYLAAMLFLFHPVAAEVRSQVLGLSDVMPLLLGATAFLVADKRPFLGLALVALAPGFKELGFLWLLGYSLYQLGLRRRPAGLAGAAVFAIWALAHYAAIDRWFGAPKPPELFNPLVNMGLWDGIVSRLYLLGHAIRLLFVPTDLSADYSAGTLSLPAAFFQLPTLLGLAFLALFFRNVKSLLKQGAYGVLLVTAIGSVLFWELHLMGLTGNYYTGLFLERAWLPFYFAVILWFGNAIVFAESKGLTWSKGITAAVVVVSLFFFVRTLERQKTWVNTATLFLHDSVAHPANPRLHFNYGFAAAKLGDWPSARDAFTRAVERRPDFGEAHFRLSLVLEELKEPDKAKHHAAEAAKLGVKIPSPSKN